MYKCLDKFYDQMGVGREGVGEGARGERREREREISGSQTAIRTLNVSGISSCLRISICICISIRVSVTVYLHL